MCQEIKEETKEVNKRSRCVYQRRLCHFQWMWLVLAQSAASWSNTTGAGSVCGRHQSSAALSPCIRLFLLSHSYFSDVCHVTEAKDSSGAPSDHIYLLWCLQRAHLKKTLLGLKHNWYFFTFLIIKEKTLVVAKCNVVQRRNRITEIMTV